MMYQWRIEYTLKNGRQFYGMYEGPENDSLDVAKRLFTLRPQDFVNHYGKDKGHMILVKMEEISTVNISAWKQKEEDDGDR